MIPTTTPAAIAPLFDPLPPDAPSVAYIVWATTDPDAVMKIVLGPLVTEEALAPSGGFEFWFSKGMGFAFAMPEYTY